VRSLRLAQFCACATASRRREESLQESAGSPEGGQPLSEVLLPLLRWRRGAAAVWHALGEHSALAFVTSDFALDDSASMKV
jgi:hypothetical protein